MLNITTAITTAITTIPKITSQVFAAEPPCRTNSIPPGVFKIVPAAKADIYNICIKKIILIL